MKKYFTIKEAAAALGVSYWTVKDLVDEAYKIFDRFLIPTFNIKILEFRFFNLGISSDSS